MIAVLLTVHTLIVAALIGVVLLQRSEGGALGIGGGGMGGFMTGRGAANVLTRTTSVLAFFFFTTSILLGVFHSHAESDEKVLEELTGQPAAPTAPADATKAPSVTTDDLLKSLGSGQPAPTPAPASPPAETPSQPAEPASSEPAPSEPEPQQPQN